MKIHRKYGCQQPYLEKEELEKPEKQSEPMQQDQDKAKEKEKEEEELNKTVINNQ